MSFPDATDKPSRTILTGEGGTGASRFKHVIECPTVASAASFPTSSTSSRDSRKAGQISA